MQSEQLAEIISQDVNPRTGRPYNIIGFTVNESRKDKRTGVVVGPGVKNPCYRASDYVENSYKRMMTKWL